MPVYVIDTLKPKNGLDFPVVEAVDVAVEGYSSLADAVSHFATDTAIAAINAALDTKADTSALTEATTSLQAQIDQIVISASAESVVAPEVAQARVDANGTEYSTLKERLDAEQDFTAHLSDNTFSLENRLSDIDGKYNVEWELGGISVNQDGTLSYLSNPYRIRSPRIYKLYETTTIQLSSYTDYRLLVFTSQDGVAFSNTVASVDTSTPIYTLRADEYCTFVIVSKTEVIQTDTSAGNLLEISGVNKLSEVTENLNDFENDISDSYSENIFNPKNIIRGYYYDLDDGTTMRSQAGVFSSAEKINVSSNNLYIRSTFNYGAETTFICIYMYSSTNEYLGYKTARFSAIDDDSYTMELNAGTAKIHLYCSSSNCQPDEICISEKALDEFEEYHLHFIIKTSALPATEDFHAFEEDISYTYSNNIFNPENLINGYYYDFIDGTTLRSQAGTFSTNAKINISSDKLYIRSIFDYGTETSFVCVYMYSSTDEYLGYKTVRFSVIGDDSYTMALNAGTAKIHLYCASANCQPNEICVSEKALDEFEEYQLHYMIKPSALPDMSETSPILSGKTVVNFGDSIFGATRPPVDISTFLAELTGATVYNCGFGGCCMAIRGYNSYFNAFTMVSIADAITTGDFSVLDAIDIDEVGAPAYFKDTRALLKTIDFSKVDIITINYGTNDYNQPSIKIDDQNAYDTHTYAGALRYSIEEILEAFPNIRVFVITPSYRWWNESGEFLEDSDTREVEGELLTDYVAKANEVARAYKSKCIDFYYSTGINKQNRLVYYQDTTHQNEKGRRVLANILAEELF